MSLNFCRYEHHSWGWRLGGIGEQDLLLLFGLLLIEELQLIKNYLCKYYVTKTKIQIIETNKNC